ncbi:hypothetical protein Dsin_007304 [Dipteronia sinensis]|uniref:Uncharacterized protein n=1 Tax=Dipteronia sinensis TaxID=43782 RepID=A0AAE0B160_9ROSI|nr:hypothetical protein Dsin_007304 [Dipteronia sinensis]
MAQFPAYPPEPNPVSIVDPQYCSPNPVDLVLVRKIMLMTKGNFDVQDINENIFFKAEGTLKTNHNLHVLLDAAGKTLVTIQEKIMSVHNKWQAFRGEGTDSKDLIFTAKKSSMLQLKTQLDVFLANNTEEDVCDFNMLKKSTIQDSLFGRDKFALTVYPNIDHSFIIALIMIFDAINTKPSGLGFLVKLGTGTDPSDFGS